MEQQLGPQGIRIKILSRKCSVSTLEKLGLEACDKAEEYLRKYMSLRDKIDHFMECWEGSPCIGDLRKLLDK